ncbi:hypothetical protein NL676_039698 [Syzygium grande]|nr:hypothetical protein NL676_039698 [Syzygium grande]
MSSASTERRLELPELEKANLKKTTNASQSTVKEQRSGLLTSDQSTKFKKPARSRVRYFKRRIRNLGKNVQAVTGLHPTSGGGGEEREKGLSDGDGDKGHPCGTEASQLTSSSGLPTVRQPSFLRFLEKRRERLLLKRWERGKSDENNMQRLLKEKSISDQLVASSVESSNSLGSSLCSRAAKDKKEVKPFFGIDLLHTKAGYVTNKGSLLSDLKEEENATASSEAEKLVAMQKQRAESDFVQIQKTRDTETELFPWLVNKDTDPHPALEEVCSYSSYSESEVGSHCSESESEDTDKKMKIEASPEYLKIETLESAVLQMRNTVEPEVEPFSLEVNKDTASEEVHSYSSEQESEVDSYSSGMEYEVGDREKSIYDQPVASSVESSISLGLGLCSCAAEDQKEVKPFFGIGLLHKKAGHLTNEGSLLSDPKEEENVMVSIEAEKVEAMQKQRAESDFVPMKNTGDTETELFPWLVKRDADLYVALEKVHSYSSHSELEVGSHCSESEYEDTDKKMKIEASQAYHKRQASEAAVLQLQNTVQPEVEPFSLEVNQDTASEEVHSYSSEQESEVDSYCSELEYEATVENKKKEVGKAIVIEALKESAILRNLFDRVICITVPLNCDMDKVQKEIAGQISSDLTEANAVDMPHLEANALEGLKFLLILVGINQHMKLETLRIPDSTPPVGSKIVFVAGSGQLCDEIKWIRKYVWMICCCGNYFQNVGDVVYYPKKVIAREIVRMCRRYSHAVILVARAPQNVDDNLIWKCAIERLTVRPASHEAGIEDLMVNVLRFSIDQLEDDKTRRCLKNLALCNNYHEIASDFAIGLWVRDGIVDTHDDGQRVLKDLVNASLLEVDENGQFVKFQDQDQEILVNLIFRLQGGLDLTEPPEVEEWESAKEICLMHTGISELPKEPSLKRLFLNDCVLLRSISPAIGRLKQLEVFDLEGTKIKNLPKEIECLINLTCLGFSICATKPSNDSKTVIPCGVISSLLHLEELNLDVDTDVEWWDTCVEGVVSEVCNLKRLSTIKFSFPTLELLRQFNQLTKSMQHPYLAQFRLLIGNQANRIMNRLPSDIEFELERCDRYLRYTNGDGVFTDIKDILQQSDAFFLERHANLKKLSELGIDSMEQLKWCVLGECNELEVLVHASDTMHLEALTESYCKRVYLESLEFLYVYYMRNLRNIWKGSV